MKFWTNAFLNTEKLWVRQVLKMHRIYKNIAHFHYLSTLTQKTFGNERIPGHELSHRTVQHSFRPTRELLPNPEK